MTADRPVTLLCLASYLKGERFIEAAKRAGAHVILLTREKLADAPWPMESIDERFLMPDLHRQPDVTYAVAYLARTRHIDRIVALDEYDTEVAAELREHLRVPGMGATTGRHFRDKLAMRTEARDAGIPVPDFVHVLNYDEIRAFIERTPAPWVIKPRAEASAMGIHKVHGPDELWPLLEKLGDRQSHYLLERFLPGSVHHVDSVVWEREVVFASAQQYGQPPLSVYQGGGVFVSRSMPHDAPETEEVLALNRRLLEAFGARRRPRRVHSARREVLFSGSGRACGRRGHRPAHRGGARGESVGGVGARGGRTRPRRDVPSARDARRLCGGARVSGAAGVAGPLGI